MNPKISIIIPVYNVEKYIEKMLISVKQQSFRDYEVIIVNDGSTDGSQAIIDMFCGTDVRFKTIVKENGGVASARNMGLDAASGEFVVFYDPDDFIPKDALKAMYKSINRNGADIVVGIMKEVRSGENRCNSHTINLSKKSNISKYDIDLVGSFSVCNKMFRREMLIDNKITFQQLKHTEDAVFSFQSFFAAKKICGCRRVVYEYHFRPFWEEKSATQEINAEHLNDLIIALTTLERLVEERIVIEEDYLKTEAKAMLKELYYRNLQSNIINGFYRQLWQADDDILPILQKQICIYKEKLSAEQWINLEKDNPDLSFKDDFFVKEELSKNSLLTFIVDGIKDEEKIERILNGIYDQSMPRFNILINERYKNLLNQKLFKENIEFSLECDVTKIKTDFVCIVDEDIIPSKNSIRFMVKAMLNNSMIDYTTIPLKCFKDGIYSETIQETAFTLFQCVKNKKSKFDKYDNKCGNKVFRREKCSTSLEELYQKKIYNANMIAFSKLDNYSMEINIWMRFYLRIKQSQKRIEDKITEYIKNYYTREDVKKFTRKKI